MLLSSGAALAAPVQVSPDGGPSPVAAPWYGTPLIRDPSEETTSVAPVRRAGVRPGDDGGSVNTGFGGHGAGHAGKGNDGHGGGGHGHGGGGHGGHGGGRR